ncbi:hypothetical protein K2X92_05120 [Candidatus Gracilibacteria bacterium]|nr:hypothetical protein [Candidatus Gracilibacteria bacterium]
MATIIYFLGVSGAIGLPYTILTRVDTVKSKTIQNTLNTVLEDGLKVEMTLEGILAKVNIADVDSVHFVENKSGKVYSIQLESIKRIAQYLIEKSGKNTFIANELLQEKEFLIQNYESQLSKNDYELLINTLSSWIENGGTVEIIKNHHQ